MASRRPLVLVSGIPIELPNGDSLSFSDSTSQSSANNPNGRFKLFHFEDFLKQNNVNTTSDFTGTAFGSGTVSTLPSTSIIPGHPGVILIKSSSTANSGARFLTSSDAIVLQGGEESNIVFYMECVTTTGVLNAGFTDGSGAAAPTDGVYLSVAASVLNTSMTATGKTSSNTSSSTTTSSATLSANTWYHGRVRLNSDASLVTFYVYDMFGNVVWSDTLSSNIPKTSARALAAGFLAWDSGTTAVNIVNVDYIDVIMPSLQRGAL